MCTKVHLYTRGTYSCPWSGQDPKTNKGEENGRKSETCRDQRGKEGEFYLGSKAHHRGFVNSQCAGTKEACSTSCRERERARARRRDKRARETHTPRTGGPDQYLAVTFFVQVQEPRVAVFQDV